MNRVNNEKQVLSLLIQHQNQTNSTSPLCSLVCLYGSSQYYAMGSLHCVSSLASSSQKVIPAFVADPK